MRSIELSRRVFLAAAGAASLAPLLGCGGGGGGGGAPAPVDTKFVAYRLSTKGKRASNAAQLNAANKVFETPEAAAAGRAHPGDTSVVVKIDLSEARWMSYFGGGATQVDLRRL